MKAVRLLAGASLLVSPAALNAFQVVPRTPPISGRIVAKKAGETAVLQPQPAERSAELRQDLKAGDILRTNAGGTLAILFADRTQIRLGRNAVLLVKAVQAGVPSKLELQSGALWGRAVRASSRLSIETPAANAGIRGTSWSVLVDGNRTVLQVYEGRIDFSNQQGNLSIGAGEAAQARKGEAPTRLVVVNSDEREQMLFYLPLTDAVRYVRPFGGGLAEQIAARNRLARIAPEQRSAEDWLQLAEAGAELDNDATRQVALARARATGLDRSQQARAALVDGLILLSRRNWKAGLAALKAVRPDLDPAHQPVADAAIRIATSVVDPSVELPPPSDTAPELLAAAFAASYRGALPLALDLSRRGETLFPADPDFLDLEASIALLLGDRDLLADAVRRGLAINPEHPGLLAASAHLKADYLGDLKGAQRDAEHAARLAPGNSLMWNVLGLMHAQAHSTREAAQAFAIGLTQNPEDATIHANRAVALLDANQVAAAEIELARAMELDPQESLTLSYRARARIQRGDYRGALQELLAASAMNPTHAQTLLLLAYVYHWLGDRKAAEQQIEIAQRYDPLSPFPAAFRSVLELDSRNVGRAIVSAHSAVELSQRVHREDVRADRFLSDALRASGLDDWARSYADRYFDPADAASYFERAAYNRPNPYLVEPGAVDRVDPAKIDDRYNGIKELPRFEGPCVLPQPPMVPPISRCPPPPPPPPPGPVFSSAFVTAAPEAELAVPLSPADVFNEADELNFSTALQGLMIDPLALSASRRHSPLFHEAFTEVTGSGGAVTSNGSTRANMSVDARGLGLAPIPFAFTAGASHFGLRNALDDVQQLDSLQAAIGSQPTPDTSLVIQFSGARRTNRLALATDETLIDPPSGFPLDLSTRRYRRVNSRDISTLVILSHDLGMLRLSAGGVYSASRLNSRAEEAFSGTFDLGFMTLTADEDMKSRRRARTELSHITAGAVLDLAPTFVWLGFEHGNRTMSTSLSPGTDVTIRERGHDQFDRVYLHARTMVGPIVAEAEAGRNNERNEYGAAVRWQPWAGHAFGAEYQSKIRSFAPFTLEPVGLAGMLANAAPAALGTRSNTLAFRWEGEFAPSFFMTAEIQRQNHEQLLAPAVDAFLSEVRSSPYLIESQYVFVGKGRVDRASLTANWLLTPNLALDVTGAATRSDQHNYLPRRYVRGQLVWNAPHGFKATVSGTYFGNRRDDAAYDGRPLDSATLIDLGLRWQSPLRHLAAGVTLYNAFDERVDVYNNFPRFGRAALFTFAITR